MLTIPSVKIITPMFDYTTTKGVSENGRLDKQSQACNVNAQL